MDGLRNRALQTGLRGPAFAAAAAFAALLLFFPPARAVPRYPAHQVWEGVYGYAESAETAPFRFAITMDSDASGRFTGVISERQTFGAATHRRELRARVEGRFYRDQILFLKTYTGLGEVRHGISYAGRLGARDTRVDSGGWIMDDRWHGWFRLRRVEPSP